MSYDKLPSNATLKPTKFVAQATDKQLSDFKTLLEFSPIGPETYENSTRAAGRYGISRDWLIEMKTHWLTTHSWRATEAHINSFPNFTVPITTPDRNSTITLHFAALFSANPAAVPICLLHGWPGSFLEFLPFLAAARAKYSAHELPYHYIVPSLPGYAFSSGPSTTREWSNEDMARVINDLMLGLGFGEQGYVAHGGDIGSFLSRILAVRYPACKAIHLNFCLMGAEPEGVDPADVTEAERANLARLEEFSAMGNAYAKEHGTRGGTIGLALSASPLSLLCWIGEKYVEWTDETPSQGDILDSVMLYWLTETFPRSIYPYIEYFGKGDASTVFHPEPEYYCAKPMGYSYFPRELGPVPVAWARKTGNLVWFRRHESVSLLCLFIRVVPSGLHPSGSFSACPIFAHVAEPSKVPFTYTHVLSSILITIARTATDQRCQKQTGRTLRRSREAAGALARSGRVHRVAELG